MTIRNLLRNGFASFVILFILSFGASFAQQAWKAEITAKSLILSKSINVEFGIDASATNGNDPGLDVITELPPPPFDLLYLNIAFASPDMIVFSKDIRATGPWKCIVKSNDEFTLSWDISSAPSDVYLVLDPGNGTPPIDMKSITSGIFHAGSYRMIIKEGKYGDLSGNRKITPFDASLVLQYIVGLINLSPEQKIAADVTGDKTVSALDAALILQYTVGLITQLPIEPITAAPALVLEQLETVSLAREQKQVLEQLKKLFFNQPSPTKTALLQNYPNPFNPETWLPYQLAQDALVTIRIYNAGCKLIRILNLGMKQAGVYTNRESAAYWDGRDDFGEETASGVYFYTLQVEHPDEDGAGDFIATRKMLLIK
ncbi:hypothetical protein FJZ31_37935 [Candidatus Poribacteria bacterium]|nr:hypothetical protein [Candidatus Poribacteria bacterium]